MRLPVTHGCKVNSLSIVVLSQVSLYIKVNPEGMPY